jgi:5-formyltetrahydrofolate cyclo-ligase
VAAQTKAQLRATILAARRAVPQAQRAAEAQQLRAHLSSLVACAITVCAYVPVGSEPGSIELLDELVQLGARVLLPVTRYGAGGTPEPLLWGEYHPDRLVPAGRGLLEPSGRLLAADALGTAAVALVPALAVDHNGVRLGRGAGFYDRSLPLADPAAPLVAVVRDPELIAELPTEPHDIPMTHALTPGLGVIALVGV